MELIQVADTVAREKNIDRNVVLEAMEEAIQKAGRSKYGHDHDIRAHIDRKNGTIDLKRYREVVEEIDPELEIQQLTLEEAKRIKPDAAIGDFVVDDMPPLDFGRIAAQTAKQVIMQKVRQAERQKQYEEFKDRAGEMISGIVKRVEYGNAFIDLGKAEAIMPRDEIIPRENIKVGDRILSYIYDVREEMRGPQIFLSRTHPQFLAKLFEQEVPEIYEGTIEIRQVARDPGSRAKITVYSHDSGMDPVGACVGMRGSRVQAVVSELQGEKIDIIPYTEDIASLIVQALQPAIVSKVVVDEEKHKLEVAVGEDQLSLAIGRRGQNVRLASMLAGWDVDIMTEEEEARRRAEEFITRSARFIEALDIDDVIAHLLLAEGFVHVEEIAETPVEELAQIEGFDTDVAEELRSRAINWIDAQRKELEEKRSELGIADDLMALPGLAPNVILKLGEHGVKTLDDLADLAGDELVEMLGTGVMTEGDANAIIMRARAHWFEDENNNDTAGANAAQQEEATMAKAG
ncbi:MAG: transcription termination/antitermination protein NusA [Rhodospirillales bacterium]|nr:transcription termination/antitermination protein NusA [Rhodospirillales bacterium]MCB9973536.1 transcription termination/antitermination protein NusA [Rhodospirillales bacterium]